MTAIFYEYANCSTCKNAKKWLVQHNIPFRVIPIVESPPSEKELTSYVRDSGLDIKRFFNTSGVSYREQKLSSKIDSLSLEDCVKLLASDGKLIKRPLLIYKNHVLVGFKPEEYAKVVKPY